MKEGKGRATTRSNTSSTRQPITRTTHPPPCNQPQGSGLSVQGSVSRVLNPEHYTPNTKP
jgi:hypothetical protein